MTTKRTMDDHLIILLMDTIVYIVIFCCCFTAAAAAAIIFTITMEYLDERVVTFYFAHLIYFFNMYAKLTQRLTDFHIHLQNYFVYLFYVVAVTFSLFQEFIIYYLVQIQPNLLLSVNAYVYMFQNFIGVSELKMKKKTTITIATTAIPIFRSTKVERQAAQRTKHNATCTNTSTTTHTQLERERETLVHMCNAH